jgi:hypothetical protein
VNRADLRARFLDVVARGIERADREHAEHLARLRPRRVPSSADGRAASRARIAALTLARRRRP